MIDKLKSWLTNWKVSVTVVGGALIIATAYGKCTVEPDVSAVEDAVENAVETEPATIETTTNSVENDVGTAEANTDAAETTTETTD
jgi:hypothetical protein